MIKIYCDGGSRGNPGPAASAFVVFKDGQVLHQEGKYLGLATNNLAEYSAVLLALNWLKNESQKTMLQFPITFYLDSQLVERQLNGFYKIKNQKLKEIFDRIKTLIKFSHFEVLFKWNPREKNQLADNLVNKILNDRSVIQREN